jgi:hypothetical protein
MAVGATTNNESKSALTQDFMPYLQIMRPTRAIVKSLVESNQLCR